jgi:hypothetical protein
VLVLFAAALVIGGIWVWQQLRSAHPLVELRLLRIRPVLTADVTVLLGGIGMYLLLTLTTRIVQAPANTGGLGHGPIIAGLAMLPLSAGSLAATWVARWLRHVPESDTGSALSFNQIFRYVGYSLGSVLTATVLQAHTPGGSPYPYSHAYLAASVAGAIVWAAAGLASLATHLTRHPRQPVPQGAHS